MQHEPSIWLRCFPDLEEASEAAAAAFKPANGNKRNRRASDSKTEGDKIQSQYLSRPTLSHTGEQLGQTTPARREATKKPDPRESYIDFLEHL
jgi:hypothetical protein